MLVLGLILLLLAAALLIGFLSSGTQEVTFDSGFLDVTVNTLTIYLLGALTLLLVVAGLALLRVGTRHAGQRRKDRKELDRLKREQHGTGPAPAGAATGTGTGTGTEAVEDSTTSTRAPSETQTQPVAGDTSKAARTETGTGTGTDDGSDARADGNGTTRA